MVHRLPEHLAIIMLFVIPAQAVRHSRMLFVIPAKAGIHKYPRANLNIRHCSSMDISVSMNERMGPRLRGDDEDLRRDDDGVLGDDDGVLGDDEDSPPPDIRDTP